MFHNGYLRSMKEARKAVGPDGDFSSVFMRIASGISASYGMYVNRMLPTQSMLERKAETDAEFGNLLAEQAVRSKELPGLGLYAFLIKPVQRSIDYAAILSRLIDLTPDTDIHRENLQLALVAVKKATAAVDESQKEYRRLQLMQKEFTVTSLSNMSTLVVEGRRLLRDTQVLQVVQETGWLGGKREEPLHLWLLNDLLLVGRPVSDKNKKAGGPVFDLESEFLISEVKLESAGSSSWSQPDLEEMGYIRGTTRNGAVQEYLVRFEGGDGTSAVDQKCEWITKMRNVAKKEAAKVTVEAARDKVHALDKILRASDRNL